MAVDVLDTGLVLAIGDLAGATFVTLLAATATQFARAGRLWTLCTIEIEVAVRLGEFVTLLADFVTHSLERDPPDAIRTRIFAPSRACEGGADSWKAQIEGMPAWVSASAMATRSRMKRGPAGMTTACASLMRRNAAA
jgi:hypothetical protein